MMFACIDCGTTHTRIFLVDGDGRVAAAGRAKLGVRDVAAARSAAPLREGIPMLFRQVCREGGVRPDRVAFAMAAGMITSELGLLELNHLTAPVGLAELAGGMARVQDREIIDLPCPVFFVRGIKNRVGKEADSLLQLDFMRGEEVQCMGALVGEQPPFHLVALSSHTKAMGIDRDGRIEKSVTTLSGQFYEALLTATSVGKSLRGDGAPVEADRGRQTALFELAGQCVREQGLLRALMMPRLMEVLGLSERWERDYFVNAAIAWDDLRALKSLGTEGSGGRWLLYGQESRCRLYERLLRKAWGEGNAVRRLTTAEEVDPLTVRGMEALARAAGLLGDKKRRR